MILNKWVVRGLWLAALGLMALWWFVFVDWLDGNPRSPKIGIFYTSVVVFSSFWHIKALRRFNKMTRLLRAEETAGLAPAGSTTFAANQRFRYAMRVAESVIVFAIGVLAIASVYHPKIALNTNYTRLVITYFIGSILLTGILTIRDLWVINKVKQLADEDAPTLVPVHHKKLDKSKSE